MFLCGFIIILQIFLVESTGLQDLSSYLTLNKSRHWLRNQTDKSLSQNPYCLICCMSIKENNVGKICGKHSMCIYDDKPGPMCKGFISIALTKDEITAIVDIHNTIRNWVATGRETRGAPGPQPRASNMRMVEWDAELALLANRWAAQCVFTHDLCRDLAKYPVGQNIAKGNYALNNDLSFIVDWYDTVEMIDFHEISSYILKEAKSYPFPSQYTQLVWAETYKIGCARIAFQRTDGSNLLYREHFICNYGPSGNIPRQPVYKIGEACSECPTDTGCSIDYPGLCTSEVLFDKSYRSETNKLRSIHLQITSGTVCQRLFLQVLYLCCVLLILH